MQLQCTISPWSPEGEPILLTGQADGGSVHDGHELLDVRGQHTVEQLLVPVLQRHQQDVPETERAIETLHNDFCFPKLQDLLWFKFIRTAIKIVLRDYHLSRGPDASKHKMNASGNIYS